VGRGFLIMESSIWVAGDGGFGANFNVMQICFLNQRHLFVARFHTQIAPPPHDRVGDVQDLVQPADSLALDLGDDGDAPASSLLLSASAGPHKDKANQSTPITRPNTMSFLSFSVSAGTDKAEPGRVHAFLSLKTPPSTTRR